jgi:hypothetical protein
LLAIAAILRKWLLDELNLLHRSVYMEAVKIVVYRNYNHQDWTVEINGTAHNHVSTATLDDLVEYALVAAQQDLLEETIADSGGPGLDTNSPRE